MSRPRSNEIVIDPMRLRIWLAARDLSYSALARRINASPSLIRLWMVGASRVSTEHMEKINKVLGTKRSDLVMSKGKLQKVEELRKLIGYLSQDASS